MAPTGDDDRRSEDLALARWQGDIERRVSTNEALMRELKDSVAKIDRSVMGVQGDVKGLHDDVRDCHEEVRKAAKEIQKGKDDAVTKLEERISTTAAERATWKITRFQVFIGGVVTFIVTLVPTLITLALTGAFS